MSHADGQVTIAMVRFQVRDSHVSGIENRRPSLTSKSLPGDTLLRFFDLSDLGGLGVWAWRLLPYRLYVSGFQLGTSASLLVTSALLVVTRSY